MTLEKINSPTDIRNLSCSELNDLAAQIRSFLINSVAKTGGHLASSLGVVELTIALHYVFDTPLDKLVWDVGHQTYTHKIITGRRKLFHTLRKKDGLSGFTKPEESIYDCFISGHSSNSLSAAQGMAIANELEGNQRNVVAVIGDGALTGGLAFEGLNNIGHWGGNIVVVLNDNEMSITKNVGSYAKYLNKLRTASSYIAFKHDLERLLNKIPLAGTAITNAVRTVKDAIKHVFLPKKLFEDLGFIYYGPIDGHNLYELCHVLQMVKKHTKPVMVHVLTKKGKGFTYAEDNPEAYHGVPSFNPQNGEFDEVAEGYSESFGAALLSLADSNPRVVAISAAMPNQCGLHEFTQKYPNRFFDVGIAEAHAVTMAAGLAVGGFTPVVCAYSSFFQRAYDQIIHDCAIGNYHVVLAIDRAGIVGADGETHQGVFDIPFLNSIPNVQIFAPTCTSELAEMLKYAVNGEGVIAIRYPRGKPLKRHCAPFVPGAIEIVHKGTDACIFAFGRLIANALHAAELLKKAGISCCVVNLRCLKPLDATGVALAAKGKKVLVSVEDNMLVGGVGAQLKCICPDVITIGLEKFVKHGTIAELDKLHGLSASAIADIIQKELKK